MSSIKENFYYSRVFFQEFAVFSAGILIIIFLTEASPYHTYIIILLTTLMIFLINGIGAKRKQQIILIRNAIKGIRKNKFESAKEIKLSNQLSELENEIKKMFLKTNSDIENMKKLELVRTEFLGSVSHELRTPIFAIQGFLETLLSGAVHDPEVNEVFIDKAFKQSQRLNNLLHDLIDISMIEAGQMKMSFSYFVVSDYLKSIVNEFVPDAAEKGLRIILSTKNPDLKLYGDKERLRQVMVNLISNSIKYTEQGEVKISVKEYENEGEIIVKDTGIGIPEEDLPRIFERFYRVDKVRSRSMGGTGLGLAIVKHILDAHQSKFKVKSSLNSGTKFSFYLKK